MQAAFVDIGWERNAYLALEDVQLPEEMEGCKPNIQDVLKPGQSLVVQIQKEAVDAKGPKVSSKISLPGKTLVLIPGKPYAAVSKKIVPPEAREVLKQQMDVFLVGKSFGLIVRTAGGESTKAELLRELQGLEIQWQHLQEAMERVQRPGLLWTDSSLAIQVIRENIQESQL